MARKKKNEVVEETVVTEPVEVAAAVPVDAPVEAIPAEPKKWVVNCHRCGAALHVECGNMVYMCPVCNNLFRVRKCEKLVKDVTRNTIAEAYITVNKGADEQ